MRFEVYCYVCVTQTIANCTAAWPGSRAKTCKKNFEGEGLCKVIIGTGVQTLNDIGSRIASGEEKNGCCDALGPQPASDIKAVHEWKHHIKHNNVEAAGLRCSQS